MPAKMCENFPASFLIDYVRVYQWDDSGFDKDDDAEITMTPDSGGSPSAKVDGPTQTVEDIAAEFTQSVTEENYEEELNNQWDTLMRKCNKMHDRKKKKYY